MVEYWTNKLQSKRVDVAELVVRGVSVSHNLFRTPLIRHTRHLYDASNIDLQVYTWYKIMNIPPVQNLMQVQVVSNFWQYRL